MPAEGFQHSKSDWSSQPIQNLGLAIEKTPLEPILATFATELDQVGIRKLKPVFYLSTEWGVPFDTVAIAIPFYLAHPELTELHAEQVGHVEGMGPADILRYLRHEMGHVVNYAYRLYERDDWTELFGPIDTEYVEEYRPEPFSPSHVVHLPGWYAQKHPDEDWAETFAVWMTPSRDWRKDYADRPEALAKLRFCETVLNEVRGLDPVVTASDLDEDVGQLTYTLDELYRSYVVDESAFPYGLEGALRAIFEEESVPESAEGDERRPASSLLRKLERDVSADVFRWTGHFPERTRQLLRHLAERADALKQVYPVSRELKAIVAVTTMLTALAMNHVHHGSYLPKSEE